MPAHRSHNLVRSIEDARNAWNSANDRRASLNSRKQRRLEKKIQQNEAPLAQSNILSEEEQANVMNLVSMFPEIEPGVIANVYRSSNGSSIAAIDKLLELTAEVENQKEEETASETESESESEEQYEFNEDSGEIQESSVFEERPFEDEEEEQQDEDFETCVEPFEVEDYNSDEQCAIDDCYQVYDLGDQNDDREINDEENPLEDSSYNPLEDSSYNPLEDSYNPIEEASQTDSDQEEQYNDDFEPESDAEMQSHVEAQEEEEYDEEQEEQKEQEEQEEQEEQDEGDESDELDEVEPSEEPSPRLITPIQPTPNHELEWIAQPGDPWVWPTSSCWDNWPQEEQTQLQQLEMQEELLRQERKREAKMVAKLEAAAQMEFMRLRIKELEDNVVRVEEEKRNGMRFVLHQIAEVSRDHTLLEAQLAERDRIISEQSRTINDRDEQISVLSAQVANLSTQLENREVVNLESFLQSSKDVLSERAQVLQQTVQKNVSDGIARLDQNDMVQYIRDVVSNLKDEVTEVLSKPINTAKEFYNAQAEVQVENQVENQVEIQEAVQEGYQRFDIEEALKRSMETFNQEFRERALRNAPVEE